MCWYTVFVYVYVNVYVDLVFQPLCWFDFCLYVASVNVSVDARGKYMKDAQHWSDDKMMLYGRAHLKANSDKVRLVLEPVLREDEGIYKCRVDFKKSPTRHHRIHLAVISI